MYKIISTVFIYTLILILFSCENEKVIKVSNKTIDSLLIANPNNVDYLILRGEKLLKEYNYKLALSEGAKAAKLAPKNIKALMLYAQAMSNYAERSVSDVATAQGFYKRILKIEPKNERALIGLAGTYSEQGDYDRSFSYINDCIKINRKYRDAYILKGTNFLALGNRKLAYSSYETAVQQDTKFFEGYLALGYLYTEDKNPIALEYFKTAAQLDPKSTDAQYGVAMTLQENGNYSGALLEYRKLLKINREYYLAYFNQGYIKQFYQNEIDSANYYYRKSLELEPESVKSWHNLGLVFLTQKRPDDARKAFNKALEYNPDFKLSRDEIEKFR